MRVWFCAGMLFLGVAADTNATEPGDGKAPAPPVSFTNDVMAILGKAGCNAGACHGHASGKGGFKLSLRGANPAQDFVTLTREQGGRRVSLNSPATSLLLQKPTAAAPHGGGQRFAPQSEFAALLRQWQAEGASYDGAVAPRVERIEVRPESLTLPQPGLTQQLTVLAHFNNGDVRDVTRRAIYEVTTDGVVDVHADGLVTAQAEGETAVLVRFLGKMAASRFLVIRHRDDFQWRPTPEHSYIDRHVFAKLKVLQVQPSEPATDTEFLRRVTLDTIGLTPTPSDVRAFLSDRRSDKRARVIDDLLHRPEFADHWALYWLELAGANESGGSTGRHGVWTLANWLRKNIQRDLPFDQFVRSLVTARGSQIDNPAVSFNVHQLGPQAEVLPQQFLGIRLQCAQCHDHPFDKWTQDNYRSLSEFFIGLQKKEGPHLGSEVGVFVPLERFLPWEKDKTATLRHLDGSQVQIPVTTDRREALADWLLGPAHRQVARALVNRVWGKLLGRGIVEPVDDMRFSNPPVNEPLLEALADDFVAHRWDFKHVVRTILNSRTYQLSSTPNATNVNERMHFSHARLRRLSAEQLLDTLSQATGVAESLSGVPPGYHAAQVATLRTGSRFLATFGRPTRRASPCTCERSDETSLAQVLHLLNGDTVRGKLTAKEGTLQRLLTDKLSDEKLIEELYLHAWSRLPDERELQHARTFISTAATRAQGAEDLFWGLLNSRRFYLNH